MFELLKELESRIERLESLNNSIVRLGKVVNRYPNRNTVRVEFVGKDGVISYELEVLQPKTKDDKFYYMPDIGEYVLCVFLPYASDVGFVLGSYYDKSYKPPIEDNDKVHIRFKDGTTMEYDRKNHRLSVHCVGDIEIVSDTHITLIAPRIDLNP